MAISEAFVRSELGPYERRFREAVDAAWADYLTIPLRHRFRFARTRANIVFDLIIGQLLSRLDGAAGVRAIRKDETVKFMIGESLLVRVKKANDAGLGHNIKTQAVMQFIQQAPTIPGLLPDLFKVEICYTEDEAGAEIASVAVTARDDDVKLWSYEIERAGAEIVPLRKAPSDEATDVEEADVAPIALPVAEGTKGKSDA
jgi:hypothetical protein